MRKKPRKQGDEWLDAKRRCGLSDNEVRMAKELGFKPHSLIKNIPAKSQPWKAPVREWIRELHAKRFGEARQAAPESDEQAQAPKRAAPIGSAMEDLLPQWDTVNEEPYCTRGSDGDVLSLEEAGRYFEAREAGEPEDDEDDVSDSEEDWWDDSPPKDDEIGSEDQAMVRRQEHFRIAAGAVAAAIARLPEVEKIILFGSVARPLEVEVPRFRKFRRNRIAISHECKDADLAVWVSSLGRLRAMQKARSQALNELLARSNVSVAHHQVDVFFMEPETDRYLGRLCCFNQCPKGKPKCRVPGCGASLFLQQHEGFAFDWLAASEGSVVLDDKQANGPTR